MPTHLDTAGLRELDAGVRARAVFTARGTAAIFVSTLKDVVDQMASGEMGEAEARATLAQTLRTLGYTPEGGFPDDLGKVPPAVAGTLQDLSSFRRLDLIVRTQLDLVRGAGQQARGNTPDRLEAAPAYELIRGEDREAPRVWLERWKIAGGQLYESAPGRMIAFKGDPVWGELGSSENFDDALDTDHEPFAFGSGMVLQEVPRHEVEQLGIQGPDGESIDEWLAGDKRPRVIAGELPLPTPSISLADVDPEIVKAFEDETRATPSTRPGKREVYDYSAILAAELAAADAAYGKGGKP